MNNNYTLLLTFTLGITIAYILFSKQNHTQSHDKEGIINNYKNNEKWHIIRDENGNLIDIEVIRDAKVTF